MREECSVKFLPYGIEVRVPKGETILSAAQKAGIYISSVCGGEGVCGKCRVVLRSGEVNTKPTALLDRGEIQANYVLACQSEIRTDLLVEVPPESRPEEAQIVTEETAERFREVGLEPPSRFPLNPPVQKLYIEVPCSTIENPVADHERLYHSIRAEFDVQNMQTGYTVLRQLPHTLREKEGSVTVTLGKRANTTELVQVEAGNTSLSNFGVAIDVGTTTIVVYLVDLNTGKTIDSEATYNSQMSYGEDYIRRIIYAEQNDALDELQKLVSSDINRLISALASRNSIPPEAVTSAVCAGNTAMIHFLYGLDPSGIRRAPYSATAYRIPPLRAVQVGVRINPRGLIYALPSISAYVGSDITAGILVTGIDLRDELSLFIDVGTNGEVVVGNREWAMACSASAGPAFEGSGVTCGMRATGGAIERVQITPERQVLYSTVADRPPRGICGSGLIDLIAELYRTGVLDRSGTITADGERVRMTDFGPEFIVVPRDEASTEDDIVITQPDIRNLLRSKAAIYAAVSTLLQTVGLDYHSIKAVYVAGGFGNYLDVRNAITVGMLPDLPGEKIRFVGNTSVAGARQCLISSEALEYAESISEKVTYVDLMSNPRFMEEFMSALFIPHTELERFPSVK